MNLMKKNKIQKRSQELLLSTYEYTTLQQEESIKNFQLRDVLDIDSDLSEQAQKNIRDLSELCIFTNIQPC